MNSQHDMMICQDMIKLSAMVLSNENISGNPSVKEAAEKLALRSFEILNAIMTEAAVKSKGIIM